MEEERDGRDRKRGRLHAVRDIELPVWKCSPGLGERKADQRGLGVSPERVRLGSPIHVAKRCGVAVVVMLRSLVIGHHEFLGRRAATCGARLRTVAGNRRQFRRSEVERQSNQHHEPPRARGATASIIWSQRESMVLYAL